MHFSEDQLRENYQKFCDEDIVRIAERDAESLTPEALQILKDEIKKRGIQYLEPPKPSFLVLEKPLLDSYCHSVQNSFCPICGNQGNLNRIEVEVVFGIGHFHHSKRESLILCRSCSRTLVAKKCTYSLLLGIWTVLPFIVTVFKNINALRVFKSDEPSESLVELVKANYQEIESIKNDPIALSHFINGVNIWNN
jgi:hypothetical protein